MSEKNRIVGDFGKKDLILNIPYCKSISNRLLVIRHLAKSRQEIEGLSDSDDTQLLLSCLQAVNNRNKFSFYCRNAGTSTRFLLALLCLEEGVWNLEADNRMNFRPIGPLIAELRSMGAHIESLNKDTVFPLKIEGRKLSGNKTIEFEQTETSQMISALLLISPYIEGGLRIRIAENQASLPYIEQTISLANSFGAKIVKQDNLLICRPSKYKFKKCKVEKDYSSLCVILCLTAVGRLQNVVVKNLQPSCLQADFEALKMFEDLGVETKFCKTGVRLSYLSLMLSEKEELVFDVKACPDSFLPLVTACYVAGKKTKISSVKAQDSKESKRLENIVTELNKLGERCHIEEDCLIIEPGDVDVSRIPSFCSYGDHRMAMVLSVLCLQFGSVYIDDIDCVSKSWRHYFDDMQSIMTVKHG